MDPTRSALVARLATLPGRLAAVARQASEPPAAEWSAADIVRHLVAVEEEVWHRRLDQLAAPGGPRPVWQHTEPRPRELADPNLSAALDAFTGLRAATVDRLLGLDEAGWARSGDHATYGVLDVEGLVRLAIDHDEEHLASLRPTGDSDRAQERPAAPPMSF